MRKSAGEGGHPGGALGAVVAAVWILALLAALPAPSTEEATAFQGQILVEAGGRSLPPLDFAVQGSTVRLDLEDGSWFLFHPGQLHHILPLQGLVLLRPPGPFQSDSARLIRLLTPGGFWEGERGTALMANAKETEVEGETLLVVSTPDALWEEEGVRTTYWLDPQRRIPVRRMVERHGDTRPNVLRVEVGSEIPDAGVFLLPEDYPLLRLESIPLGPTAEEGVGAATEGETVPPWIFHHPPALVPRVLLRVVFDEASLPPEVVAPPPILAWEALFFQEGGPRFAGVVWVRGNAPSGLLEILVKPFVEESGLAAWRVSRPGWEGRVVANFPRPQVMRWFHGTPEEGPAEAEPEETPSD